jgi:hypothetical protein
MGYRGIEPDGGKLSNPVPRREKDSNHPEYPQVRLSFSPDIFNTFCSLSFLLFWPLKIDSFLHHDSKNIGS